MVITEKLRNHLILEQFCEKGRDQSKGRKFIKYIQHLNDKETEKNSV